MAKQQVTKRHIALTSRMIIAFVVVALAAVLFVKLAGEVRESDTLPFDRWLLMTLNHHSMPWLDAVMPIATDAGGVIGVAALTLIFGGLFAYKRQYARLALLLASVAGVVVLNLLLKSIFMQDRPDLWAQLVHESGYSFPSGHTMGSAGVALALVVAMWQSRCYFIRRLAARCYDTFTMPASLLDLQVILV